MTNTERIAEKLGLDKTVNGLISEVKKFVPHTANVLGVDDCYRCRICDMLCEIIKDKNGRTVYGCPVHDGLTEDDL